MRKIIQDILGGILISVIFILLTITLIKSSAPHNYLSFYLALEIISFMLFSLYGAAAVATASTFVAIGTLIIAGSWLSVAAILSYWGAIVIMNTYLVDISEEYGSHKLDIENKEKEIGELSVEEKQYSSIVPILKERISKYIKMSDFSLKLGTSFNHEELFSFVLEYVEKFFPDKEISLLTVPEDQYDHWVLEKKKPLLVENTGTDYRFEKKHNYKINSLIECPLFQNNKVIGAVKIESDNENFTASDLRLLNVTSTLSSIAQEKAWLFNRTQELAITDDLTGLYTHTYFKERLEEEVKRAAIYGEHFVVFMIDIDKFKYFNDTYGHLAGDIVLKNVTNTIQQLVRETDIVGRYGGEEIAVILHSISQEKARIIAERIRKSIETMEFVFDYRKVAVTATIGGAFFPESPTSEVLIKKADKALYTGKDKGRNKVIFHGDPK